jgi:hypothetical protein
MSSSNGQATAAEEHALRERLKELEAQRDDLKRKLEAREDDSETQAQSLLRLAENADVWRSPEGELFATYPVDGRRRTSRLRRGGFRKWLRIQFHEEQGKPPGSQALQDAIDTLAGYAELGSDVREVSLRVAGDAFTGEQIFVDLGTEDWQSIKVTPGEWESTRSPDAQFRRVQSMKALPQPIAPEGNAHPLSLLREHVRVKSDEDFALLLAWMVQALRPEGPYPVLVMTGEQGSGKTTTAKMIRSLVDPSHIPTRSAPRQEEDLVVAAENAWVLAFDNMSGVSPWLSDALCRLSTGGGFGTRQHYTNREEATFYHKRPLILNGIEDLTARPDLADRSLVIQLEAIPEADRKSNRDLWSSFEEDRSAIFYGLLDALSTALDFVGNVDLDSRPRMMDFAEWATAAEPAFPLPTGTFEEAYATNRERANETALENDPVALAIVRMLQDQQEWTGKTSDLQEDLKGWIHDPDNPPAELASYQALGQHLRRIMPVLREAGVERQDDHRKRSRRFKLTLEEDQEVPF